VLVLTHVATPTGGRVKTMWTVNVPAGARHGRDPRVAPGSAPTVTAMAEGDGMPSKELA